MFLRKMEGGCSIPAFGLATLTEGGLQLTAGLASLDGKTIITHNLTGSADRAEQLGEALGEWVLENGGRELLAEIKAQQG
jgi:hydroxymethylbilane synthase